MWKNKCLFLVIFIIIIKACFYYYLMGVEASFISVTMLSVSIITLLFILFGRRRWPFFSFYTAISLLMFTNVIYNRYFHMNFSLSTIIQAGQLEEIQGIILSLIKPLDFILILDAFIILIFSKESMNTFSEKISVRYKSVLGAALIIVLSVAAFNPINSELLTKLNHQEFFSFYLRDICETFILPKESNVTEVVEATRELDDKGQLFGVAKDRNLIMIQVESLQDMFINKSYNGQEITPNLNQLIKGDSLYFNSYYQQLGKGNTSDAEFVSQNSLYAPIYGYAYNIYQDNSFYGLPWILREKGYKTLALHGYKKEFWNREKAYIGQGFERFISEKDYDITEKIGLGISDKEFFKQSVNELTKIDQTFYSFLITLSSHNPFGIPASFDSLKLKVEHQNSLFGNYLKAVHYTDEAIGEFIQELKQKNLYDNSIIVIYGDHFGINVNDDSAKYVSEFLGCEYTYDEMMNIPLIINIPKSNTNKELDIVGGQVDLMPTLLNLMGISDKKLIMFGKDLVNAESGFVASQTVLLKGSFIDDDTVFEMARSGIFEDSKAWNRLTKEPINIQQCKTNYEHAIDEINKGMSVLEQDALKQILAGDKAEQDIAVKESIKLPREIIQIKPLLDNSSVINALDSLYTKGCKAVEINLQKNKAGDIVLDDNETFEALIPWLEKHSDFLLVINNEKDNLDILNSLSSRYSKINKQVVPQIYSLEQYVRIEYYGYKNTILNLSKIDIKPDEIKRFIERNKVLAVSVPSERLNKGDIIKMLKETNTSVYGYSEGKLEEADK